MTNENWQGINLKGGNNTVTGNTFNSYPPEKPFKPIKYIPKIGNPNFVGREDELVKIHKELYQQENSRVAISSVSGMGGVGKTELAIQYAHKYYDNYSGGIGWFNVRDTNLADEIIQFIQLQMGLEVPQDIQENPLTLEEKVAWCWQNWQPPEGLVLVVLDDVTEYKDIKRFLPRTDNQRFKLLITTRQRRLDTNLVDIPLDVLSEDEALSLLRGILGEEDSRIDKELETTKNLCQWLGYLPLGLELVGRYLVEEEDLSIAEMLEELKKERLENEAINPESEDLENKEMTAKLGVKAAFNLTWEKLDSKTRKIAELLSLFNPNAIAWNYVESVNESLSCNNKDVKNAKKQLRRRNVIKRLETEEASYQIHPLIREFLQYKLQASAQINELKQAFASNFINISKTIPQVTTLEFRNDVKNAIPHLIEVAENHLDVVRDKNLFWAFTGLGRFYEGQGLYSLAEPWYQHCVSVVKFRLGENHSDFATSLHNLASIYIFQGNYEAAEPFYLEALELRKQQLGENHIYVAYSLRNLSSLYNYQGKYDEAEPLIVQALKMFKQQLGENHADYLHTLRDLALLYSNQKKYEQAEPLCIQALELRKQLLGVNHPDTTTSLNDLANLYNDRGKYEEAKPLFIQALELRKQLLGENHPHTAQSLRDLAYLYKNQGKYEEAEPFFIQALELRKQLLGENHPYTAASLNDLGFLYYNQEKYEEAEPFFIQALELRKQLLGVNHPHTATSLNNLAFLYKNQGKYDEAESLYIQALELYKQLLGENHPDTALSLNNLANLYSNQGKYEQAEPLYIQAVEIAERVLGKNHQNTVTFRKNLEYLRT